jgi:hypothetical protein
MSLWNLLRQTMEWAHPDGEAIPPTIHLGFWVHPIKSPRPFLTNTTLRDAHSFKKTVIPMTAPSANQALQAAPRHSLRMPGSPRSLPSLGASECERQASRMTEAGILSQNPLRGNGLGRVKSKSATQNKSGSRFNRR